jgi:hypothetical protein
MRKRRARLEPTPVRIEIAARARVITRSHARAVIVLCALHATHLAKAQSEPSTFAQLRARPVSKTASGRWQEGLVLRTLGLRTAVTTTEQREPGVGVSVAERAHATMNLGKITARYADRLGIGWGSAGLEGMAFIDATVGVRPAVGVRHGPVLRLGLQAGIERNTLSYTSLLQAPQLELGYQWLPLTGQLELVAQAGYMISGRLQTSAARHTFEGPFGLGGLATARWEAVLLTLQGLHVSSRVAGVDDAVRLWRGSLCGLLGSFMTCFDGSRSAGVAGGPGRAAVWQLGLSLTFGSIERR